MRAAPLVYAGAVIRVATIAFACEDPEGSARFWAGVLGRTGDGDAVDLGGGEPVLEFRHAAKTPTIEAPIHLDVNFHDREAAVERLLALGARLVETKTSAVGSFSETFTVLRDPEGNGFCAQGPDPRAHERPLLRNVTFACTDPPALAAFWAAALGYRKEELDAAFVEQLLAAGLDPAELDAYVAVEHPEGRNPRLLFQRRQKTPASEPALQLELEADGVEPELERLVELGANVVADGPDRILTDPEGNRFGLREAEVAATR